MGGLGGKFGSKTKGTSGGKKTRYKKKHVEDVMMKYSKQFLDKGIKIIFCQYKNMGG